MLVSTLNRYLPQKFALRAATFPGLRAFSLTVPALEAKVTKSRAKKEEPPTKIRKQDLKPPFKFPGTAWSNFLKSNPIPTGTSLADHTKENAKKWAQMSQAEKDVYAPPREEVEQYFAKRKEWKKSLPKSLKRMLPKRKFTQVNAYAIFTKEKWNRSLPFTDASRALHDQWKSLSEAERQTYRQRASEMTKAGTGFK